LPSLLTLSFLGPSGGSRESNNGLGSLLTLPLMGAVCGAAVSLVISGSSR
jgi:hypothetical protein